MRLVDADELLKKKTVPLGLRCQVISVSDVEQAPTVDAVEVVHSAWILNDDGSGTCKHCHRTTKSCWDYDNWMNFCPNCGVKMDLEENNK